jgi:hypothetical protein
VVVEIIVAAVEEITVAAAVATRVEEDKHP